MFQKTFLTVLWACCVVCALSCGGGGGSSGKDQATTEPVSISGPDGSTLNIPSYGIDGGESVNLKSASDGSTLVEDNETLVSNPYTIETDGDHVLFGDGVFSLSIPVTVSAATQTDKLLLKVKLADGTVLPVYGAYNAETGNYEVDLAGIDNGWAIAVVENKDMVVLRPQRNGGITTRGWLTDLDWETYEWAVINQSDLTEEEITEKVMPDLWNACDVLARAGFRSPKIYIDPRLSPAARVVHLIKGVGQNDAGSHFHPGAIVYADGSWQYTEEDTGFSTEFLDADQMSALGQMYINYDQYLVYNEKYGVTLGNIVIHELLHAVQSGYDVRRSGASLKAYMEGTATPVGQTYQDTGGSITGTSVSVRTLRANQHARLHQAVDDPTRPLYYTKQDFFAYVAKRYGGNSFAYVDQLFEYLNNYTANQFGLTKDQYRTLYRQGMDAAFTALFTKGLPEIYKEYALDRAYQHSSYAILRPLYDTADKGFEKNMLAATLFKANENDTTGLKEIDPEAVASSTVEFPKIEPLSCYAVTSFVPEFDEDTTGDQAFFPLTFDLEGGDLATGTGPGIRIFIFLEDIDGIMVKNGDIEVTDISQPVQVPVMEDAELFTVLILNTYVDNKNVKATLAAGPYIDGVSPDPAPPGSEITINGSGFGDGSGPGDKVTLDGAEMPPLTWTSTSITFTLPATASSGDLQVTAQGMTSNEVLLTVGKTTGNWEMKLDIYSPTTGDTCDDSLPYFWEFMRFSDWIPVTVSANGTVTFSYTGPSAVYANVGGSNLTVNGSGTFLNNELKVTGTWEHNRSWSESYSTTDSEGNPITVFRSWSITCNGTFTGEGEFNSWTGDWFEGDFSGTYSSDAYYQKTEDNEVVDTESGSCSGTINHFLNDIMDFRQK